MNYAFYRNTPFSSNFGYERFAYEVYENGGHI